MHIGIPIAGFHRGNPGEYAQRALTALGHSANILTASEFLAALSGNQFDSYLCVDSGEALPLNDLSIAGRSLERVGYWFIDYRHNKTRPERVPNDLEIARTIHNGGGWIFQSQFEDAEDCRSLGMTRVEWLPLAADPQVWSPEPVTPKEFDIGFAGHVYDIQRKRALDMLSRTEGLRVGFAGQGAVWKEDAAALMRRCAVGFNITSFFGEPIAYDVNMRVFETLSCGVPLFTNDVPSLSRIFPEKAAFIRTYSSLNEMIPRLLDALEDKEFLDSGAEARRWVLDHATYEHRMQRVINRIAG